MLLNNFHPIRHVQNISAKFPGIWNLIEQSIAQKTEVNEILPIPEWCFLPHEAYFEMIRCGEEAGAWKLTEREKQREVAAMCSLVPWNYTRYIYEFDVDFYQELNKTVYSSKIPREILYKLPVYSIYIKVPENNGAYCNIQGYWASIHPFYNDGDQIHVDSQGNPSVILNIIVNLGDDLDLLEILLDDNQTTLLEALNKTVELKQESGATNLTEEVAAGYYYMASEAINAILYICSQDPDIKEPVWLGEKPGNPRIEKIKGKFRLFPPRRFKTWKVGNNVGKQIKEYHANYNNIGSGKSVRPHIRRAHWHGYWTGPKKGARNFEIKWLSPMLVATTGDYEEQ